MTIQCCCDAAKTGSGLEVVAGEPVSCDELRPRVEGKIEEQNIMDLTDATREQIASRLREGEDLEDLVTIKRVAMEVSDVEINCREGYRLSRDGQTCEECVRDSMFCRSSEDAEVCSSHGECECGECQCQEGWQGRFCDCTTEICPSDESGRICSEHGDCILQNCSQPRCECHHRWYGDLCECSDVRCPRGTNGWMCSSRGTCTCGRCDCPEGILGLACESCRQIEDIPGRVVLTGGPGAQYTDCFYTCSPRSTNRVLVKVVAVGRHCKSADVTISSGRCNNKTDSSSLCNDESVFYLSTSNCLCFTFRRPVGLKVELKFASHDGRLAPLVDFLFKNNMLEEYAMDADGWSRLELILLYPSRADTTRSTKPFFDMLPKVYQDLLKSFK
ncbi:delta-like protein 1 [Corticium candelabrum]|uniref:delta-like protein 1 n=1 Tax=Corticium candelabrum TaxID=121492 RepID=UPI002E2700CE|nr:delta-like protein 1 [Corticium candelabrum]